MSSGIPLIHVEERIRLAFADRYLLRAARDPIARRAPSPTCLGAVQKAPPTSPPWPADGRANAAAPESSESKRLRTTSFAR